MQLKILLSLICCMTVTQATCEEINIREAKVGKDHPLLSRFEGAKLIGYKALQFDEAELPMSAPKFNGNNKLTIDNLLKLEGKYTRIAYVYAKNRSGLEVYRNYQAALAKAGLKVIFTCEKEACGNLQSYYNSSYLLRDGFLTGSNFRNAFNAGLAEPRYLVATGKQSDGSVVHIAVLVVPPVRDEFGGISLQIVERKPMETGKVAATLNASELARSIAADGKVAVYGVYFDSGKADIKPESTPSLTEMAKLLQQDGKLKVHIVGHTDNQGSPAYNVDLSQKRAEAVVKALATDYRIDTKRLNAKGVASYAPVASNNLEAGREKNRRVEIVQQ
jgi:OOP family OmpA-OmpF porin